MEERKLSEYEEEEKKEESIELRWDNKEDRSVIAQLLKSLGFDQTAKREDLFVKQIDKDNAVFVDFSKSPKGAFYAGRGSKIDVNELPEYKAFRYLQKGRGRINPDNPNQVIVTDDEGREQIIEIQKYEEKPVVVRSEFYIEWQGRKYPIKQEFVENIMGRFYPNIKGIIDVVQRAEAVKEWVTEMIKEPQKITKKKPEDKRDPEYYEDAEDIESKDYLCVFKATVVRSDGKVFTAHGSAHPLSVSGNMRPKVIEMAETRALARALRFAFNIHQPVAEEVEEEKEGGA